VYDLSRFSPLTNARFDHPDPSILTVLSAPLDERGSHCVDFVAFVPRWDPTENTFRPPYFHRNATTELNGIVRNGPAPNPRFTPGTLFLTPNLTPHSVPAPSVARFNALSDEDANRPSRTPDDSLWFQFESALPFRLTPWAQQSPQRDFGWPRTWGVHRNRFRQ
jgi:homogentisate 1,2-dioxygenase